MLRLSDVTLVLIETREHDLALLALEACERQVEFAETLVFTDRPSLFAANNRRIIKVPDWPEKVGWSRCFWYEVANNVLTSHALGIQWDSWVANPQSWSEEFLEYDYIGAPWWYEDGMNVGNGGFCLRSTKLMRFVRKHRFRFPCANATDDALYCRTYRPTLQEFGFEWAPNEVAGRFAWECVQPKEEDPTPFGFHAAYNFGKVLSEDELIRRAQLMLLSPNLSKNGVQWKSFVKRYPELMESLSPGSSDLATVEN
jgi:hypothetical protein